MKKKPNKWNEKKKKLLNWKIESNFPIFSHSFEYFRLYYDVRIFQCGNEQENRLKKFEGDKKIEQLEVSNKKKKKL